MTSLLTYNFTTRSGDELGKWNAGKGDLHRSVMEAYQLHVQRIYEKCTEIDCFLRDGNFSTLFHMYPNPNTNGTRVAVLHFGESCCSVFPNVFEKLKLDVHPAGTLELEKRIKDWESGQYSGGIIGTPEMIFYHSSSDEYRHKKSNPTKTRTFWDRLFGRK